MKNKAAQDLAYLRVKSQTPDRRKEIARKAANTRWSKVINNQDLTSSSAHASIVGSK